MLNPPSAQTLAAFGLQGELTFLPGGEGRTYKVNNGILKYVNPASVQYANWIADVLAKVQENGFRVARPIATISDGWVSEDNWSAWSAVEGIHSSPSDIATTIPAIQAFHEALRQFPQPDFYAEVINNEYGRADAAAWGETPASILPDLRVPIETLYALRIPVTDVTVQLIHGDLNPENILIAPDQPPAIIDLAPYYRPPEFALAIYAYWIGPWRGDATVLENFKTVSHFKQMLLRAALRMLLIVSEFKKSEVTERYLHATEIVRKFVSQ